MKLIKQIWNKVVDFLELDYQLEVRSFDIRLIFVVYTYYINIDNYAIVSKAKNLIEESYKQFYEAFPEYDKVSYSGFERSVYRIMNTVSDNKLDFLGNIKKIVKEMK